MGELGFRGHGLTTEQLSAYSVVRKMASRTPYLHKIQSSTSYSVDGLDSARCASYYVSLAIDR